MPWKCVRLNVCFSGTVNVGRASDGWIDDLRFYILSNSISVISGGWEVDNEWLCATELRLRLRRFRLKRGSNSVG